MKNEQDTLETSSQNSDLSSIPSEESDLAVPQYKEKEFDMSDENEIYELAPFSI